MNTADLYTRFNTMHTLVIKERDITDESGNVTKKSQEVRKIFFNKVKTIVESLCLHLNLKEHMKHFYLYVLKLFFLNLANAMMDALYKSMMIDYSKYLNSQYFDKNKYTKNRIESKFGENQRYFDDMIGDTKFKYMYDSIEYMNICYNYISIICFITYVETDTYEFVDTLKDKILKGDESINLIIEPHTIIPTYVNSNNNNFCINCNDCSSCLCCYACNKCTMCNCCIHCTDCYQSMYCIDSGDIYNSFYINNSIDIYFCHKCCRCNTCYYSDHTTACNNVMYISNVSHLKNNKKSFIQSTGKDVRIDNHNVYIDCFLRRVQKNVLLDYDVFNSIPQDIIRPWYLKYPTGIYQLNTYFEYSQIIDKCSKHNRSRDCEDKYTNVEDKCSLIYGCNYPDKYDIYFTSNKSSNYNFIVEDYCEHNNHDTLCNGVGNDSKNNYNTGRSSFKRSKPSKHHY